jgi:hypothetical protein
MTVDERLVFLLQSTESLHSSLQELHAIVGRHDSQIEKLTVKFDQVADTLGDLAIAVLNHEKRLGKLHGGGDEPPTRN